MTNISRFLECCSFLQGGSATGLEHMKELASFAAHVVDELNTTPPASLESHVPLRCDFRDMNALTEFSRDLASESFDCIHFGAATAVREVVELDRRGSPLLELYAACASALLLNLGHLSLRFDRTFLRHLSIFWHLVEGFLCRLVDLMKSKCSQPLTRAAMDGSQWSAK